MDAPNQAHLMRIVFCRTEGYPRVLGESLSVCARVNPSVNQRSDTCP